MEWNYFWDLHDVRRLAYAVLLECAIGRHSRQLGMWAMLGSFSRAEFAAGAGAVDQLNQD